METRTNSCAKRKPKKPASNLVQCANVEALAGEWPDVSRLFSSDPWRGDGELLHESFAGVGGLDRWFGDFSSSRFQPRIDVVDDGDALRVTAELPAWIAEICRRPSKTASWSCVVREAGHEE